jgi:hypothetical protein
MRPAYDPTALLADVRNASDQRNGIVHSLWLEPAAGSATGWRHVRRRRGRGSRAEWVETSVEDLKDLIARLVRLALQLRLVMSMAAVDESDG